MAGLSSTGSATAPCDDERDLAAHAVGGPGGELGQRAAAYLLVGLGQLPAHRGRAGPAPKTSAIVGERRGRAVRRLEEHHRPLLAGQRGEPAGRSPGLRGQEPLEAEPVHRQAGDRERGEHRRRARDAGDRDARLDRRGHQPVAGVGDARHAGVGDQHDPVAAEERLEQRLGAEVLVALEVGHHPAVISIPRSVASRRSRRVSSAATTSAPCQLGREPRRGVVGPADGRRGEHEHAGRLGASDRSWQP